MAVLENTAVTFFGDRRNRQQMILGIPAQSASDKPGILCLQDVDNSGVIGNNYFWFDSTGQPRYDTSIPTNQDSDGTAMSGLVGPGSSTDNAIVRWNGTGGTTVQNSAVTIADGGAMTIITYLMAPMYRMVGISEKVGILSTKFKLS